MADMMADTCAHGLVLRSRARRLAGGDVETVCMEIGVVTYSSAALA